MSNISKLVRIRLRNIGCIGDDGLTIELDNIVCLVGRNNVGKSTILRAYELALGVEAFNAARDRCQWCQKDASSEIELEVHIPPGIGNVDEKWKRQEDDLLIVRSRWQWQAPEYKSVRSTWDPEIGDWAAEGKAGGADNVFKSRLPKPLRVGSLQDAEEAERTLLTLALIPLMTMIEKERASGDSGLAQALGKVVAEIKTLSVSHEDHFNQIASKVTAGFKGVFPKLDVRLNVEPAPWTPKIDNLVKEGSGLRIKDGSADTSLIQQGTGARRALFWAMLQVHNELKRESEMRDAHAKQLTAELKKEEKKKNVDADRTVHLKAQLLAMEEGGPIPHDSEDPAFPGYLLLIDEPENALHPIAARAAQRHLYKLAESADWQVILTTHSPYFINPFEDHTTIVRLERSGDADNAAIVPRTYQSDLISFEGDEKKRLQALQHLDPSLAEIFFGSYPVLVEGDTEHAAFMASIIEKQHDLIDRVTVIRARGKAILTSLIGVLRHFKIDFGIAHDCDAPFTHEGKKSAMWSENDRIRNAIVAARDAGVMVRHRVSIPDFERYLGGEEESKDKPINAYRNIAENPALALKVQALLHDLLHSDQHEPVPDNKLKKDSDYLSILKDSLMEWAVSAGLDKTPRFCGKI